MAAMSHDEAQELGDFTATRRMIPIAVASLFVGVLATFVARFLLDLINVMTNLFYYQRLSLGPASPADNTLGAFAIVIPVIGAIIIGFMARYGSERIRGHGIPEALEAIMTKGSKIQPRVALLKPISSAISIGSGGPFGAEGPIIMTGGAFGSLIAQLFSLTAAERKTLLVAGAAAGMAATFATPVAAILLGVELLVFEWKPRSFIPIALASATASAARVYIIGAGPLFPMPEHLATPGWDVLACCVACGLAAGILSALLTGAVYACEDLFKRLPMHWMWWPAIGGLIIGVGGLIAPHALGVGYDVINGIIHQNFAISAVVVLMIVKAVIWSASLGSGTSGGVLAPLLMTGGALGAIEAHYFPGAGLGFWALLSMGAVLAGTMGAPLTGILFIVELTHDMNMFVPLVITIAVSYGFSVLVLKRSILTEKIARRGLHVSREYAIDELEVLMVRDVMTTEVVMLRAADTVATAVEDLGPLVDDRSQNVFPVLDDEAHLVGAVTRTRLLKWAADPATANATLASLAPPATIVTTNETLRAAVQMMAAANHTTCVVVNPANRQHLVGLVALHDMLKARARHLEDEQRRERVLPWEYILPRWIRPIFDREPPP